MLGCSAPGGKPAGRRSQTSGRRFSSISLVFPSLLLLMLALLVFVPLLGGCGTDKQATADTTAASTITTAATTETTEATAETTGTSEATFPVTVTDDAGNTVTIKAKPVRIVSTAPANTETLFALGAGDRVVGVNSLDNYPPEVANLPKVGDYQANTEAIVALSPDLVVGYSGNEEALAPLQAQGVPVLIMNPANLEGIYTDINAIGSAVGAPAKATELVEQIKADIARISQAAQATGTKPKVFYALDNTLWTCGPGSFVDELLSLVSVVNVAAEGPNGSSAQPYYQFTPEQLVAADPDIVLLPGSVYKSADEFTADPRFAGLKAVKEKRVLVIDDVLVTRPGPRIAEGLRILAKAVHPEAF